MSDASDTIRRRRERTLYASKVIQQTYLGKGYTNRVVLEGGDYPGPVTYPAYEKMRDGTVVTTPAEAAAYVSSVPNREPDSPTNIVATGASNQATVYFTPPVYPGVSPVLFYRLYISPGPAEPIQTSSTAPFLVSGLTSGQTYTFRIRAVNAVGPSVLSMPSNEVYIIGTPDAPSGVSGVRGNTQVTVSFSPSVSDGGAPVLSYTAISSPGDFTGSAASSPITVAGLTNGTPYTFRVFATNANGDSDPSSLSGAVTPATVPDPPTNVTAVRGNTQVSVEFQPPLVNGGDPITAYTVTASPGGATATGPSSPLVVTGLTNGTPYTFTVVATNGVGSSASSAVSNAATPATTPDAPTAVSAVAGNGQAVVSFSAPASNGGSTITSYTVTASPGGATATGGSSPITVIGLSNGTSYTFTVIATNGVGSSGSSMASNAVTPTAGNVPGAPTAVSAIPGNTQAIVSFTAPANPGSTPITSYTVTSSPGGFTASGASSPLAVSGLTNGTAYTFSVVATNSSGNSNPGVSNQIVSGTALAPVLTATSPTINDVTVTFTQTANGTPSISNYKYSLNGGPFTALSPADPFSPIKVSGLTATTNYNIQLKAVNVNGDSLASNTLNVTTYTTLNVQKFTTPGSATWVAPAGVTSVEYFVLGGGGGGGACYSDILVLGDLPFTATAPSPTAYWIRNNGVGNTFYGYFYRGNSFANISRPFQASVLSVLSNSPPTITPNGTIYVYNKWYADTIVYWSGGSVPNVSNYFQPYNINTARCNNISGGGGGGSGGQLRSPGTPYSVTPGNSYTIVVGAGGVGGVATATTEAEGGPGGSSTFDTITALGGSGGSPSRSYATTSNGFALGGRGGQNNGNFFGGSGGGFTLTSQQNNYGLFNSGGNGFSGYYINFDSNGAVFYSRGGNGGVPNTVASTSAPDNLGRGGDGTGATLNSFANGRDGGSGIVMLKWYT